MTAFSSRPARAANRRLLTWTDDLRQAVDTFKALRHCITSLFLPNLQRYGTHLEVMGFKSAWARAMVKAMGAGSLKENLQKTFGEPKLPVTPSN